MTEKNQQRYRSRVYQNSFKEGLITISDESTDNFIPFKRARHRAPDDIAQKGIEGVVIPNTHSTEENSQIQNIAANQNMTRRVLTPAQQRIITENPPMLWMIRGNISTCSVLGTMYPNSLTQVQPLI